MKYDLPDELTVTADGPVRTVLMNRAAEFNCVNENLHTDEHRQRLMDFQRKSKR